MERLSKINTTFFILIGLVLMVEFSFWGFRYFPVVDDNNQIRYVLF